MNTQLRSLEQINSRLETVGVELTRYVFAASNDPQYRALLAEQQELRAEYLAELDRAGEENTLKHLVAQQEAAERAAALQADIAAAVEARRR